MLLYILPVYLNLRVTFCLRDLHCCYYHNYLIINMSTAKILYINYRMKWVTILRNLGSHNTFLYFKWKKAMRGSQICRSILFHSEII